MTYIFMIAGKGSRLQPLTLACPKSMYMLDENTTVFQRMVNLIRRYDSDARIVAVTGFMHQMIEERVPDVEYVYNPFYAVTNSMGSLWCAREFLDADNAVLLNGDIVVSESLIRDVICRKTDKPLVLLDSSIKEGGDYNAQVDGDKIVIMSKELDTYFGEYVGITKLDADTLKLYKEELQGMVENGLYDQWFEDVLVQMIFKDRFSLYYRDVAGYPWTEIDCVSDLRVAQNIHQEIPDVTEKVC